LTERIQNVLDGITPTKTGNCIKEYDVETKKFKD